MIQGNQTWLGTLQAGQKKPLYVFEIPDLGLLIGSFPQGVLTATSPPVTPNVSVGGYGIALYGVSVYGT
jgi:hypothetical protein